VNYNGGHSLEQATAMFEVDVGDVRATTAHTDRIRSNVPLRPIAVRPPPAPPWSVTVYRPERSPIPKTPRTGPPEVGHFPVADLGCSARSSRVSFPPIRQHFS
jgi:hypothetical protein